LTLTSSLQAVPPTPAQIALHLRSLLARDLSWTRQVREPLIYDQDAARQWWADPGNWYARWLHATLRSWGRSMDFASTRTDTRASMMWLGPDTDFTLDLGEVELESRNGVDRLWLQPFTIGPKRIRRRLVGEVHNPPLPRREPAWEQAMTADALARGAW
jgi:hypothetical protein